MSLVSNNIKYLRKRFRLTQEQLAERIGIKRSLVGAYEEGRADPRLNNLATIAKTFNVTVDTLIGTDVSKLPDSEFGSHPDHEKGGSKLKVLSITVDRNDRENIELVPQKAAAGYLNGYADPEYIQELPKFRLPMLGGGTYRAFEISGDSMLPLESGTVIIGQYVEHPRDIGNGKCYILLTNREGVVFKRVFNYVDERGKLFLVSDNKAYSPYEVDAEDVLEIWEAKAYISMKLPGPSVNGDQLTIEKLAAIVMDLQKEVIRLKER